MKKSTPINFWGIGAQKAGTSWLYYNLSKTPGFSIPPVKEFHYFDRGTNYTSPNYLTKTMALDRLRSISYLYKAFRSIIEAIIEGNLQKVSFYYKWYFYNYNDEWYKSLFKGFKGIKGEITPSYSILEKKDITRMYEIAPDAKLILLLRNPVDRAWSHFRHVKKRIKGFSLDKVETDEILDFMNSEGQILRSDYIGMLKNYTSVFPKEQILVGFYDAIKSDPEQLLQEIIAFTTLGTEPGKQLKKNWKLEDSNTKKVINKSIELDCPPKVLSFLKEKYHDMILELANNYGGYFNKWYFETYAQESKNKDDRLLATIFI